MFGSRRAPGANQVPFDGQVDYDVIFWIDSDMFFIPDQVMDILRDMEIHPGVPGRQWHIQDERHATLRVREKWDDVRVRSRRLVRIHDGREPSRQGTTH